MTGKILIVVSLTQKTDRRAETTPLVGISNLVSLLARGLKNDCASQCPAVKIVGSGAGSFKMEACSREKKQSEFKMKK